jgi:hypothetical protein
VVVKDYPGLRNPSDYAAFKRKWQYLFAYAGAGFSKGYITCHMRTFIREVSINNSKSNNQWLKIIHSERYTDTKMRLDGDSMFKEHFLPQNRNDRLPSIPSCSIYLLWNIYHERKLHCTTRLLLEPTTILSHSHQSEMKGGWDNEGKTGRDVLNSSQASYKSGGI